MDLFEPYKESMENLGGISYQVMGNHDYNKVFKSFHYMSENDIHHGNYAEKIYEDHFGPINYSFDIGNFHVLVLESIDYKGGRFSYNEKINKSQINWVKEDLKYVDKSKTLLLNLHATMGNEMYPQDNIDNFDELYEIIKDYNTHIFSGHSHQMYNNIIADNIYEHNVGASCGVWWADHYNQCGTPNGYLVVELEDNNVKWYYKCTGKDYNHKFRAYLPGEFKRKPKYLVVNMWDYDPNCKLELFVDGEYYGELERFKDYDQAHSDISHKYFFPHRDKKTDHLFKAKLGKQYKEIEIKLTNRFGEIYTEKFFNPKIKTR